VDLWEHEMGKLRSMVGLLEVKLDLVKGLG